MKEKETRYLYKEIGECPVISQIKEKLAPYLTHKRQGVLDCGPEEKAYLCI